MVLIYEVTLEPPRSRRHVWHYADFCVHWHKSPTAAAAAASAALSGENRGEKPREKGLRSRLMPGQGGGVPRTAAHQLAGDPRSGEVRPTAAVVVVVRTEKRAMVGEGHNSTAEECPVC